MKQVFYKGLLALTIAFGMTSCDKNEMEGVDGPLTSVTKGLTQKVSFGESVGITVKGKGDVAGKTASEFAHIYSTASQTIVIKDSDEAIVFMGSYAAGNIAGGIIAASDDYSVPIILQNGDYTVKTLNEGGLDGIGFLPYNSSASFSLDGQTGTIALQSTLLKGFLIVNVEDAAEDNSVDSATYGAGDAQAALLGPDDEGDYYGYLFAGTYPINVNYTVDDAPVVISGTQVIGNGAAYTINLELQPNTPAVVGSLVGTMTLDGLESDVRDGDGLDVNTDGDLLDSIQRVLTTTTPTLNGEASGPGLVTRGAWYLISNKDINISSDVEESTELAIDENINPGTTTGLDDDLFDTISRVVTTTQVVVDETEISSDDVPGVWSILVDYSAAGFGSSQTPTNNGADVLSAWAYEGFVGLDDTNFETIASYAFGVDAGVEGVITRTRTIDVIDAADLPAAPLSESRTISNSDFVPPVQDAADTVSSTVVTSQDGGVAADAVNDGAAVESFHFGDGSYTSLALAQAAADATGFELVVNIVQRSTQSTLIRTSALIETVATTYSVMINGLEDAIAPVLPANTSVPTQITAASNVAGVAVVSNVDVAYTTAADTSTPDALPGDWVYNNVNSNVNADAPGYLWDLITPQLGNFAGKYLAQFTIDGTKQTLEEAQAYAVANGGSSFAVNTTDTSLDQFDAFEAWANAAIASEFNN